LSSTLAPRCNLSFQTLLSPHPHSSINYGSINTGMVYPAPNIIVPPWTNSTASGAPAGNAQATPVAYSVFSQTKEKSPGPTYRSHRTKPPRDTKSSTVLKRKPSDLRSASAPSSSAPNATNHNPQQSASHLTIDPSIPKRARSHEKDVSRRMTSSPLTPAGTVVEAYK